MVSRFNYSRWDGTQRGFEFDAQSIVDEISDDLLYHGDVNAALRRLMQEGMRNERGDQLMGLREMMQRLRERREEIKDRGDLGGVYSEISAELDDLVDEERHAIDEALMSAEQSGDQRRAEVAKESAQERNFRLDMLPSDLAGKINELEHYVVKTQNLSSSWRILEIFFLKIRRHLMSYLKSWLNEWRTPKRC